MSKQIRIFVHAKDDGDVLDTRVRTYGYALHFGVRPQDLATVLAISFEQKDHVLIEGDSWNTWGERGTPTEALHVIVMVARHPHVFADRIRDAYGYLLEPIRDGISDDALVVSTDPNEWSEDVSVLVTR